MPGAVHLGRGAPDPSNVTSRCNFFRCCIVDRGKVDVVDETGLTHLLRRRLKAQADMFAALTSHPTLIGTGREDALAELLRQFMPRRFEILQGTVAVVDEDDHRCGRRTSSI